MVVSVDVSKIPAYTLTVCRPQKHSSSSIGCHVSALRLCCGYDHLAGVYCSKGAGQRKTCCTTATVVLSKKSRSKSLHREWFAREVTQSLVIHGLEVWWLIIFRSVIMVCELHKQVSLQQLTDQSTWKGLCNQEGKCTAAQCILQSCCMLKALIWTAYTECRHAQTA